MTIAVRDAPLKGVKRLWKVRAFAKRIITHSIRGEILIRTKSPSQPQTSTLVQSAMKILNHGGKVESIAVRSVRCCLRGMEMIFLPSTSSVSPAELPSSETGSPPMDLSLIGRDAILARLAGD